MIELQQHAQGVVVPVKAHAGARRNGITGVRQGMVCISVTQVPEKGKANKAIAGELAKAVQVRPSDLELLSGDTSSIKRFLIADATLDQIRERLQQFTTGHR